MAKPSDGMQITQDVTFEPGIYLLPSGIHIRADGVTVNGNGALIVGCDRTGQGVTVSGHKNITIQNLCIQEYYFGLHAQDCQNLTVRDCQITSTAELSANTLFLDVWLPANASYGGGIFLQNVTDSQISQNLLMHQMNGLHAYLCRRLTVRDNNTSYCSGWGFHVYETCDCLFEDNTADYCCRYEPRGERGGHMGADAAGFLILHRSCRNRFLRNNARMGGDGFFLAGMTPNYKAVGCDDNLFEANDGSFSPNIAFEATFSQGNIFRDNLANRCNYGFWLGFSRKNQIENNQMIGNQQAGIATENGTEMLVRGNLFQSNGFGILLWSKRIPGFEKSAPDNTTSYQWLIEDNQFLQNRTAIRIAADQDHGIRPLPASGESGLTAPKPHHHTIRNNQLKNNGININLHQVQDTLIQDNQEQDFNEEESR